jgi:hypothetical protein
MFDSLTIIAILVIPVIAFIVSRAYQRCKRC